MEFPTLGKQCSYPLCRQLDFLPFTCDDCKDSFCLEHRRPGDHECASAQAHEPTKGGHTATCPLCSQILPVPAGQDTNARVEAHISSGCTKKSAIKVHKCDKCKASESFPIICKDCGNNYCLRHRFFSDHACTRRLAPPRRQVAFLIDSHITKTAVKAK
eukprot:TRINITY_DN7767_c0_g1_i1.p1 TRINITY_DN7767_c0_g1~~TRINITY_DN7767_c0_g1_i1.p1  ORF type:complete len:183 (-),score=3.69 TRINITY_DN7767_c0_g1_i1:41-517(-)